MTDEGPSLDSFLRHLQTEVEAANEIADKSERNIRLLQLESSIQEAIIFANRYKELQNQGVDPLLLVDPKVQQERPAPPATKGQAILLRFINMLNMWQTSRERSRLLPGLRSNEVITLLLLESSVQRCQRSSGRHRQRDRGTLEELRPLGRQSSLHDRWCGHQQLHVPYRPR